MKEIKLFDYQKDMKERTDEGIAPSSVRDGTNANGYG